MDIVTATEMRDLEQRAVAAGSPEASLMERAAQGIAVTLLGAMRDQLDRGVLVVAGPGNNGGDALLAGYFLASAGCPVDVWQWNRTRPAPIDMGPLDARLLDEATLPEFRDRLARGSVVVDGLLGTGRNRPIEGSLRGVLRAMRQVRPTTVVAVDLPTGVDADTGSADEDSVRADLTIALGAAKPGHFLQPGAARAGRVVVVPIGLPPDAVRQVVRGSAIDDRLVRSLLPERPADSNKGTFGRVLVVAGSRFYTGAPYLCAMAAARAGAGLVTAAVPRDVQPILASRASEYTFEPLPGDPQELSVEAVEHLEPGLARFSAIVLGPGLGQSDGARAAVYRLCTAVRDAKPEGRPLLVVDADALNMLALRDRWWDVLPEGSVLTPHPGEMGRLTGKPVNEVQADRVGIARASAQAWKQTVVLKGAGTVVANPDGRWWISPAAVPALATAGTGDVLAGAIGGLAAQGSSDAAACGVWVHARAGELVARRLGDSGLIASDLLDALPLARRAILEGDTGETPLGRPTRS